MEESPLFPEPEEEEDDDEDDGKTKKKAPSLAELFAKDNPKDKEKVGLNLARSLFSSEQKDEAEEESEGETASEPSEDGQENKDELAAEELTPEEEIQINRAIAEDHLENPVTDGQPLPPVTDFLERVADGEQPDEVYRSELEDNELNPAPEEKSHTQPPIAVEEQADEKPSPPLNAEPIPTPRAEIPQTPLEPKKETSEKAPEHKQSVLSGQLTEYVLGRRHGNTKAGKEKIAARQKKLEHKVAAMEANLTDKENTLQQLTREKKLKQRINTAPERVQPGRNESRIGMTKPEKAGLIGKVVVNKEKQPAGELPVHRSLRPEQVKTMRRQDLLDLSEKINVEGASLKSMFENHLFGEGALRRLVEASLRGRELMPLLRREVLEKQLDYERDPVLRDLKRTDDSTGLSFFDKMLAQTKQSKGERPESLAHRAQDGPVSKMHKKNRSAVRFTYAGAALSITIALLIGLIIYLIVG